jgi:FkbM family methyltransferase
MKKLIGKTADKIGRKFTLLSQRLCNEQNSSTSAQLDLGSWYRDEGDKLLKLNYEDLNEKSIVFDLGGYEGQWSSDIFAKYCSYIHIFEPVEKFSQKIENRFSNNPKIFVHNFGLDSKDGEVFITVDEYNSSIIRNVSSKAEKIKLRRASTFIKENLINNIDLMKVNIEGGEYSLLEDLIDSGCIKLIRNILIQFHDFVPDAENRMKKIQSKLSETHNLKWQYSFVWESWQYKD